MFNIVDVAKVNRDSVDAGVAKGKRSLFQS